MILKTKDQKGISLVEVMVTIAISGILFAMMASVIASFVSSYQRSLRIRELNYEVETIENYVTLSIKEINLKGEPLVIVSNEEGFIFQNSTEDIENKDILTYNKEDKVLSFKSSALKLEYTSSVEVREQGDSGIVLTITTVDNTEFVSYYKVLNITDNGSGE